MVLRAAGHLAADVGEHGRGVGDLGVDLAALRVPLERLADDGQLLVGAADLVENEHRGDEPAVGPVVAGEVVVRRMLAAEHRTRVGHHLLDERMADLRAHRHSAVLADHLGNGARADQVVQDRRSGIGAQRRRRQHRGGGRTGQPGSRLVDDEHPVGIAVEREAEVEATRHDPRPHVALVGGLQRVGGVVRERAVELRVHHLELDRLQPFEHRRDDEPAHPVGGVGDDTQRPQRRLIDERHDMVDERGEQITFPTLTGSRARAPGNGRRAPRPRWP